MLAKLNILVVDDDDDIRELFTRILIPDDYEVCTVSNGEEAVKLVKEQGKFDFAFVDIRMPGMNGIETLKALRKTQPGLKAAVITGFSDDKEVSLAFENGAVACLKKPFDLDVIQKLIKKETAQVSARPMRILAVDDEQSVRDFFGSLESSPHAESVRSAGSAEEALKLLDKYDFDIAFVDIVMPGMNGLELCDRIHQSFPDIGVVLFTGYGDQEEAMQAKVRQKKAIQVINKPFDLAEIEQVLWSVERRKSGRRQLVGRRKED